MAKEEQGMQGWIARAQREGLSQNATKKGLREAGFRFGDQTFASLWGEIDAARALRGDIADANTNRRPLDTEISRIQGGSEGKYLYRFDTFTRRFGESDVIQSHIGIGSDHLITYDEAMDAIYDVYGDNEDTYGSELLALVPAAVNQFSG